jgi:predicted ribosomally synthesized peptide with SipW-like signal peptide
MAIVLYAVVVLVVVGLVLGLTWAWFSDPER